MKILAGFKQFVLRGNVVDLSVGVVIGAAFGTVISALVKDVITPFIGVLGKTPDFSSFVFTVNGSKFMLGDFLNALISFLIAAATMYFFVVVPVNSLVARANRNKVPADPTTKKCPECLSEIPKAATRCAQCGIKLEEAPKA